MWRAPGSRDERGGRVLHTAGLVLAAVLVWAAAPSTAWAGCGDYIVIGNPSAAAREHQRSMSHLSAARTPADPSAPAPGKSPCRGVHCGRDSRSPSPQSPAPPTPSPTMDRLATLPSTDLIEPLSHVLAMTDDARVPTQGHLIGPDPPPRS
jgi:hypothetical protein